MLIRVLLVSALVGIGVYVARGHDRDRPQAVRRLLLVALALAAVLSVLWPQVWTAAAQVVGVGRGADLLLYLLAMVLLASLAVTRLHLRDQQRQITVLARALALAAAPRPAQSGPTCLDAEYAVVETGVVSTSDAPLPEPVATAIFDLLVTHAGVSERKREDFLHHQTTGFCSEYRVQGDLAFGGKFWRNPGHRPDGSWGECWYVSAYPEDERYPMVRPALEATNAALQRLHEDLIAAGTVQ